MSEKVEIKKKVFRKPTYLNVIDTKFNEFVIQQPVEQQPLPSINTFFEYYNSLFFSIPKEGNSNSHKYIVEQSSKYVGADESNPLIVELQNEIADLKKELLNSNQTILDLTNQLGDLGKQFKSININNG